MVRARMTDDVLLVNMVKSMSLLIELDFITMKIYSHM
jgi:hypothetical protein